MKVVIGILIILIAVAIMYPVSIVVDSSVKLSEYSPLKSKVIEKKFKLIEKVQITKKRMSDISEKINEYKEKCGVLPKNKDELVNLKNKESGCHQYVALDNKDFMDGWGREIQYFKGKNVVFLSSDKPLSLFEEDVPFNQSIYFYIRSHAQKDFQEKMTSETFNEYKLDKLYIKGVYR